MKTVADIFRLRIEDSRPALYFEDRCWSAKELVAECVARANYLLANKSAGAFHVGMLLDNVPEHVFWIGACALAGATMVGLNSTRKGADLARDIAHTECQFLITETKYREEIPAPAADLFGSHLHVVDGEAYDSALDDFRGSELPSVTVKPDDYFCLIFTSGTGGAPKAVIYSNRRVMMSSFMLVESKQLTSSEVAYVTMPLFHSLGLVMGLLPALIAGGTVALRRRFSASEFLADVRKYGVTSFFYVGKPLAYILATEEKPDDGDNPLRTAYGAEATEVDIANFSRRFACQVADSYGSSEGCVTILRNAATPKGSLGIGVSGRTVVMNPESGRECPRAVFDANGILSNSNEAIGELVNLDGGAQFEGYWKNPDALHSRVRDGIYWSGDLGYRDANGFFYFAGRDSEWLRVDGENLSAIQIEQVLVRHPLITVAAVYGVPDPLAGDQVMAALELLPDARLDFADFQDFLQKQKDFGSKWLPSFVRISPGLPTTPTNKVLKRLLKKEKWRCADPVWWKPGKAAPYQPLKAEDAASLEQAFAARGRAHLLQEAH